MKVMPDVVRSVICFFAGSYAVTFGQFLPAYTAGCACLFFLACAIEENNNEPDED